MNNEPRYLPRLVTDCHDNTWPEVGHIGAIAWTSGEQDLPLETLHMEATEPLHMSW